MPITSSRRSAVGCAKDISRSRSSSSMMDRATTRRPCYGSSRARSRSCGSRALAYRQPGTPGWLGPAVNMSCFSTRTISWCPGGLAAQVAQFERHPDIDAVFGEWYTYDVQAGTISRNHSSLKDDDVLSHLLRTNIVATPSAMMLRRTAVSALGGFDTSLSFAADWEMWLRLAKQGCRFARVTAPVATYRIHGRSMTSDLDRAIGDVTALLDRCFRRPLALRKRCARRSLSRGSGR